MEMKGLLDFFFWCLKLEARVKKKKHVLSPFVAKKGQMLLGLISGLLLYMRSYEKAKTSIRAIFIWPWKMVSVSVRFLFYQPIDKKIKTWSLRFPAKENPNMEKALFDRPIVLQYDVKAKFQLISRKFSGVTFVTPSVRLFARFQFKVIRKLLYLC